MGIAVARRQLHEAELVAAGIESERLGVDRDRGPEIQSGGQVALVKLYGHRGS